MRYIYGLYDRAGVCLYVGNTQTPKVRMKAIAKYGPGDQYKPRPIQFFCGMVLRTVEGLRNSVRVEHQMIRAYKCRGEARENRSFSPGNLQSKDQ